MDLKQLEAFVRVAELGSFTRAAAALGVAQPALSRQIRALEVELHQTLLRRNGRGALTTEAGALLLDHGRGILHQVARAHEELGAVRGSLAGRVALGLPTSLARGLTVPITRAFTRAHPQASLAITEGMTTALSDALRAGRIDLALLYNPVPQPEIELQPLALEELVLVQPCAPSVPGVCLPEGTSAASVSRADLAQWPLIIPSRPNAFRMQVESELAGLGLRARIALEIDGVTAILALVADGLGCAVLSPQAVAQSGQPQAYVQRAFSPPLHARIMLASSALRPATHTQRAAAALLRSQLAQLGGLQPWGQTASAAGAA